MSKSAISPTAIKNSLNTLNDNLNPVRGHVNTLTENQLLDLAPGAYSSTTNSTNGLPTTYGTLFVTRSNYGYGGMIYESTYNTLFFRSFYVIGNDRGYRGAWQEIVLNSKYKCGYFSITLSGSAQNIDGTVNFPSAFPSGTVPIVTLTLSDNAQGSTSGAPKTSIGVTRTLPSGFNYRVKTDQVTSGDIQCYWIAMIP